MKIGILTYHKSQNCGAMLQAIATRVFFSNLGNDVYYIDYFPDYHKRMYEVPPSFNWRNLIHPKALLYNWRCYCQCKKRYESCISFQEKFIIPFCKPMEEVYDVALYGSDQIWRIQPGLLDYNSIYFADGQIKANKHIAFAASTKELPKSLSQGKRFNEMLKGFSTITVREEQLNNYIIEHGYKSKLMIDPTLLLSLKEWDSILPISRSDEEKYALYICWQESFDVDAIKMYSNRMGLKTKILYGGPKQHLNNNELTITSPYVFLGLIKNASFVFTSSFHGLAFSLIYQKPFIASLNEGKDRVASLLSVLELSKYMISPFSDFQNICFEENYEMINKRLISYREQSIKILEEIGMV